MLTQRQVGEARQRTAAMLDSAGIVLTPTEREQIEVADFGLSDLDRIGLQLVVYVNTERSCAKELVLFPHQTCPEHRHPRIAGRPGKEETFRCRRGVVHLYVPGTPTDSPAVPSPPGHERGVYTVWREITLHPGEQHTVAPNTKHWFQAGPEGSVVSEFSTASHDEYDIFTDPLIMRETRVASR